MGTTGQSITLANSIIGVGILAMPFCFQQCGVLLATLILLIMGLISRLCCYFLLKSALLARRRTFEFLAFHVFGPAGKMAVEVGIIGFLMGTCIAYFVVVGDLGPQIIAKMFNINQSDILRTSIMVIVSLVCVLPLGLLRNVDSLSNVSAATIGFYFCLVIKVIADAASELMTGEWQARVHMWRPAGLLQCVPIFSMALFCQTQLFEIFESLPTLSLEKMNVVTKNAINICTSVYFTLGVFGYIAFSSQDISGNILMSLSPTMGSDVIKLGFVMSLAFSFPLIIFPCRASLYSFLYKKVHSSHHDHIINHSIPEMTFRCITVAIIAVALFISLLIPNIELVLGLVGSTIGVLICLVFPAACFVNVTFKNTNERVLAKGVIVLGLIIMVLGTYANLQAAENQLDRYDEKFITQERIDKIVEDFFEKQDKSDVYLKPADKNEPIPENHNIINSDKINKNIIKDSEVQPPNPIPPESNEKVPEKVVEEPKLEEKKLVVIPAVKQTPEKVADSHPKDLKTKLEAKLANGDTLNVREDVEKNKEVKPKSQETKIDVKQQKLMETIKQHGEEQKEILDEIIKTKKELQQNKKEADSNEAKKIAVESIKQIANIAIQSLGGVTEKPNQVNNDKKSERLEKLTNEAVQEIAKKAFETIEAIQEIKENPEAPVPKSENEVNVEVPVPKLENQVNVEVPVPKSENQVNAEIPKVKETVKKPNEDVKEIKQNLEAPEPKLENLANPEVSKTSHGSKVDPVQNNIQANQVVQPLPVKVPIVQALSKQESANDKRETQANVAVNVVPQKKPVAQQVANQNAQIAIHNNIVQKHPELSNPVHDAPNEVKTHTHSPDEPKSYKRREDTQVKNPPQESNIVNLDKAKDIAQPNKDSAAVKNVDKPKDILAKPNVEINDIQVNKVQSNGAYIQTNENPVLERRKREADDCTKKINSKSDDLEEYLPRNLDINSIALPKDLPLDANMFHHLSRSLKNYDKDER